MQVRPSPAEMIATGELFSSYNAVEARREWEIGMIKEKLERNEKVDTAVCRVERASADSDTARFGLKRGKLLYLFKYPDHNVEREKHRNVITRARFIKNALERAGYRLVPWDFKKGKPPTFWEEATMEEEDDDLYGPSETPAAAESKKDDAKAEDDGEQGDESMNEGTESGDDDDESDSDLEIIIDKPLSAPKPATQQAPQESKAIKIEAPQQPSSTPATKAAPSAPQVPSQPGTAYPAVQTSTIEVNADPIYPAAGKPISQLDMDADLAESTKPWRLPGADQSDYFNYGFDEFTWEMYRQRQTDMSNNLNRQKAETAQFQQMFMGGPSPAPGPQGGPANPGGGGGVPGGPGQVPGAPTGPSGQNPGVGVGVGGGGGGMPGMPPGMGMSEEQMMQTMMQMQAQGMDVGNMDISQFMQMVGGGGMGGPGMGGPGGGFGGPPQGGQGGGRGGRRGGRGGW